MIRYALYLISLLALLLPAYGESRALWTIGSFDHSYREFAPGLQSHVLYRIGKSNPAKDWPDTQNVGSSYTIQFPLTEPPRGTFLLKIGVQVSEPGIPALQLQVNGHEGKFYLHPKLSNDVDAWAAFDPHNSVDLLQIPIPASYLRIGKRIGGDEFDEMFRSYVKTIRSH